MKSSGLFRQPIKSHNYSVDLDHADPKNAYSKYVYPLRRALIRPGRFDTKINVPMPDVKGRHDILKLHLKNVQVADGEIPCCACTDQNLIEF